MKLTVQTELDLRYLDEPQLEPFLHYAFICFHMVISFGINATLLFSVFQPVYLRGKTQVLQKLHLREAVRSKFAKCHELLEVKLEYLGNTGAFQEPLAGYQE